MANTVCTQCGAPIEPGVIQCKYCGEKFVDLQAQQVQMTQRPMNQQGGYQQPGYQQPNFQQPMYQQPPQQQVYQHTVYQQVYSSNAVSPGINPAWPIKSKTTAGVLGIFLGGLGIHKFYLGKIGMGILYLLFCWTYIPAFIGFIEGIIYLTSNEHNFQIKNRVRLR